jgi:hypothetical protein
VAIVLPATPNQLAMCERMSLTPLNDQHQRWEPAAGAAGIASDLNGWLPSAVCCC